MSSSLLFSQLEEFAGNEAGSALKWMNAVSICSAMLLCKVVRPVTHIPGIAFAGRGLLATKSC